MRSTEGDILKKYEELLKEVYERINNSNQSVLLRQENCELEHDFLGFLENYELLRQLAPKDATIIDFGCNMAAQTFLFVDYPAYLGVDLDELVRFATNNTIHYQMSIQNFLKHEFPALEGKKVFGICSAVPDATAVAMAEDACDNILILYPGEKTRLKIDGEYKNIIDYLKGEKL